VSVLGKRKATHLPMREDPAKKVKPAPSTSNTNQETQKPVVKLNDAYLQQQEEHLKSVERERKYQQTKKMREESGAGDEWAAPTAKKGSKKAKIEDEGESDMDDDAIDMRREDAELEAMLREYNNEGRERKPQEMLEKPLDLPFYKGI